MSTYSTLQNAEQATEIREEVLKPKHVTPNLIPVNEISKYGFFVLENTCAIMIQYLLTQTCFAN